MPKVSKILHKVTIISARSAHEPTFPDDPTKWKFSAFQESLSNIFLVKDIINHVISFGDSNVERQAIKDVVDDHPNIILKTVKFRHHPTMEELHSQHEMMIKNLDYIFKSEAALDLQLTITVITEPTPDVIPSQHDNPKLDTNKDNENLTLPSSLTDNIAELLNDLVL